MNEHNFNLKWFDFSINGKDARKKEIVTHLENGSKMLNLSQIQQIKLKALKKSQQNLTASTAGRIDRELINKLAYKVVDLQKDYTNFCNDLNELKEITKEQTK